MRFGIIGPTSKDHVFLSTGGRINKYGAIAYSAMALAKLLEDSNDQVVCLSHISPLDIQAIHDLLKHPNIDLTYVLGDNETQGTEIELIYVNQQERISRQVHSMSPITTAEINRLPACDAIILMPLNETDIPLECIKFLRKKSNAFVFLDAHGLVTGVNAKGERFNKYWEDREAWFQYIDILKMNDKEASWVAGHHLEQYKDYVEYAVKVIRQGLTACWITFGEHSSLIAWQRDKQLFWADVPVGQIGEVIDTTGCGDSASAGFVYSYTKFKNPLTAVVMGNTFGSLKASFPGINGFPSRPDVRGIIYQHYRDYFHQLLDDFFLKSQLIIHEVKGEYTDEGFVPNTDGDRHCDGTDYASGGSSQGTSTPGT